MKATQFPNCCAGVILYEFGGTGISAGYTGTYSKEEIDKFLIQQEYIYDEKGFILIAVNEEQNKFMGPILTEHEYKCVGSNISSFGHPDSAVFLWLRADYKDE